MTDFKSDFLYFRDHYAESMEDMFASVGDLYAEYWNDYLHFPQFQRLNQSWQEAFDQTHKKYAKALNASRASSILELACGRGGFCAYLAENFNSSILGIDISQAQIAYANKHKAQNLSFKHHDIMQLEKLDGEFDAIVFMDAACYLPDKKLAIDKIYSKLNKGGRFLLIDWCKTKGLNSIQEELVLYPFMKYWAIPSLETPENYLKYLKQSGFVVIKSTDLTSKINKTWNMEYTMAIKAINELTYKDAPRLIWKGVRVGPKAIRLIKEQFAAALYIKAAFDAGFLQYSYFLVEKK